MENTSSSNFEIGSIVMIVVAVLIIITIIGILFSLIKKAVIAFFVIMLCLGAYWVYQYNFPDKATEQLESVSEYGNELIEDISNNTDNVNYSEDVIDGIEIPIP